MRLHIFGASGAGVTTLGHALEGRLHVPYFDSDEYYWEKSDPPFTIRRPAEPRNARLRQSLDSHADWILGGSVIQWGLPWAGVFDLAVLLWVPPRIRLARLRVTPTTRPAVARWPPTSNGWRNSPAPR